MKYKAIGLAALCGALLVGLLDWQMIFGNADKGRYEQHKDAPAKQACTTRHSEGELCTHLPVISIETQETIPGKAIQSPDRHPDSYIGDNNSHKGKFFPYL